MKKLIFICFLLSFILSQAQQTNLVDFTHANARVIIYPDSSMILGRVNYRLFVKKNVDSVYIDAVNMRFDSVAVNKLMVKFTNDSKKLWVKSDFKKDSVYNISFKYTVKPKKALYFTKKQNEWNIWTQGQGKYTSHWFPSFDDTNEKVIFNMTYIHDIYHTLVANGKLKSKQAFGDFLEWNYAMQKPMSSYLLAFVSGEYKVKEEVSKSGIPLKYYYYRKDTLKIEPTYRYTKQMFDYLENEIGVNYPWQNYKQVPVHDFLYSGMENTSLTIFSDAFVVDSTGFYDKNYVNVNAHELAHQWFGDLVTAKSGEHHWLQEGFATYYALLAEKEVFGQDYFNFKLFSSAQDLERQNQANESTSLLNPKSSSLTFYQRGAWVLHALRTYVGDEVFQKSVKSYLEKFKFSNAETDDFIVEVERFFGKSLVQFRKTWIEAEKFPYQAAVINIHQQSDYIKAYVKAQCEDPDFNCKTALGSNIPDGAKVKIIAQRPNFITSSTFNNSLKVRQAISKYLQRIPKDLKTEYETLLDDASYITIENALYNLWKSFPEDRIKYLSKTRNIQGFNNKNVRLLWLLLHLNTPEYNAFGKENIFAELKNYTKPYYNFELRMNAFNYLEMINACDENCIADLKQATTHHNWRMVKFAKDMLKKQNK